MYFLRFALYFVLMISSLGAFASQSGSVIIAEGFSALNEFDGPLPSFFEDWCTDSEDGLDCVPTVMLEVTDVKKTKHLGYIYAWGKDFKESGSTLQFKEFILYDLKGGQLYTLSQDGGHPGGAFTDPSLIPPKEGEVVLAGGAEGIVVGGTGKYKNAGGGYSTRLKVEAEGPYFIYYDELYIRFREVNIK
jgi:hypothetical protein